jgi:hypothetical protein
LSLSFDLPPTAIAKPLPAFHKTTEVDGRKRNRASNLRGKNGKGVEKSKDDTPREFARLLNFQKTGKRLPKTLDDGNIQKGKKGKSEAEPPSKAESNVNAKPTTTSETATYNPPDMKIRPGERLAEFSARVDQTLPIAGLLRKGRNSNSNIPGVKTEERRTKHNRRLERMQKEWREEEARRRERLEEEMEDEAGEKEEQHRLLWDDVRAGGRKKKKRKPSRKGGDGGTNDGEDLWAAELEKRRLESRQKNLQDVVRAPPQLKGVKGRLKDHSWAAVDVGNVPGSVGSLRKREEMGEVRRSVIDEYRKLMGRNDQAVKL